MSKQWDEAKAAVMKRANEPCDMFRGPDLQPGDLVAVEINGVLHTEVYKAPKPPVYPQLSAGKRLLRQLTPARWRKPRRPIRELDPVQRAQALTARTLAAVERLTAEPKVPWWRRWIEGMRP